MAYKIVMRPQGRNPGVIKRAAGEAGLIKNPNENLGGIVILISDGSGHEEEVSRVAYIRRASRNPSTPFKAQLKKERGKAEAAVAALNEMLGDAGVLQ